jgi:hypothetical protein
VRHPTKNIFQLKIDSVLSPPKPSPAWPNRGKDVSRFFSNSGKMLKPIQRVNVDFTASMLEELENAAKELNISRQAVIKTLIRQAPRPAPPRPLFPPPLVPSAPRSFCVSWRVAAP